MIAVITLDCIDVHVLASSLAAPRTNIETPCSDAYPLIFEIISFSIIDTASSKDSRKTFEGSNIPESFKSS